MKTIAAVVFAVIFAMLLASQVVAQENAEFHCAFSYYFPSDDRIWDDAFGTEVQIRFWSTDSFGTAVAAGAGVWEAIRRSSYDPQTGGVTNLAGDGDWPIYPFGGSILFRPMQRENVVLTLEAGIRYLVVDYDAEVTIATASGGVFRGTVSADDAVVGVFQSDLGFAISETVSIIVGAGFQFVIDESNLSADTSGLFQEEIDLKALNMRAGAVFRF